jgi:alpha-N-arabinofuranosidase
MIDAIATVDESGKVWAIALVNRHLSKHAACTVKMKDTLLEGRYEATILAGDSPDAFNDVEHPNRVVPERTQVSFKQGVVNLPPHSLVIVRVPWK